MNAETSIALFCILCACLGFSFGFVLGAVLGASDRRAPRRHMDLRSLHDFDQGGRP